MTSAPSMPRLWSSHSWSPCLTLERLLGLGSVLFPLFLFSLGLAALNSKLKPLTPTVSICLFFSNTHMPHIICVPNWNTSKLQMDSTHYYTKTAEVKRSSHTKGTSGNLYVQRPHATAFCVFGVDPNMPLFKKLFNHPPSKYTLTACLVLSSVLIAV